MVGLETDNTQPLDQKENLGFHSWERMADMVPTETFAQPVLLNLPYEEH
jgi:hypothetical protein